MTIVANSPSNTVAAVNAWQAAVAKQSLLNPVLAQARNDAFAAFLKLGLPTTKLDAWKYTDLRRLALKQFRLADNAESNVDVSEALLPIAAEQRLIFVDGQLNTAFSRMVNVQGVSVHSLNTSQDDATQSVRLDERGKQSAFELLNMALASNEIRIAIPADSTALQSIYIAFVWTQASAALMNHPRIVIRVGHRARVEIIEHHVGLNAEANFTNAVTNIDVGELAHVMHTRIQEDAATNFLIANLNTEIARSATYINHNYVLGGGLSRHDIQLSLAGVEAQAELHGLIFAQGTQHLDVRTCADHKAPNTRSTEDYRGIADQRGRVVFNGKVIVRQDAQKTDARQSSRNLLLSPTAEIDTRPELEIYANDVKCAHGATVGQLDAAALFYLQSRGLNLDDARGLLIHAFATELLERMPNVTVRDYVLGRFMNRMQSGIPH